MSNVKVYKIDLVINILLLLDKLIYVCLNIKIIVYCILFSYMKNCRNW